jgi:polyisoprenoid-binding protein YceI
VKTNKTYIKGTMVALPGVSIAIVFLALLLTSFSESNAQTLYSVSNSKEVYLILKGTSTLHDWSMQDKALDGQAHFHFLPDGKLKSLDSLSFSVQVDNLKSDEKAMDNNAYKALKADRYKDILFKLISSTVSFIKKDKYEINALGNLTIAGVTREIILIVKCEVNNAGKITCTGSEKLNMTDFHVNPPTFLMGIMKTGDAITLEFKLLFDKSINNN